MLRHGDPEDLSILVDYLTDKGEGRIMLDGDVCKRLVACQQSNRYEAVDLNLMALEIRRFGGNTVSNLVRDARNAVGFGLLDRLLPDMESSVDYGEIVRDVASHLKVPTNKNSSVPTIEDGILRKILTDSYEQMSTEEKKVLLNELGIHDMSLLQPAAMAAMIAAGKLGGFATFKLATIVANAVAKVILGKGLPFVAVGSLMRSISVLIGPVGMVLTGLWTIADMASPAYRVTVPCVVHLAYMRQKALHKATNSACGACGADNPMDAKFCSECGKPMNDQAA